ncbi:MAG: DUF6442 family protein [Defluviitaleaceae bacterium]|nr:DUF6442 family protein [Defluviitaleaceae bacterium]MCL2240400.1 DUF6442 family protein [Defluviitaleaceae bacterium]
MDNRKEEILEMSRQAKQDEGLENMTSRGIVKGHGIFHIVSVVILLVAMFGGGAEAAPIATTVCCLQSVFHATEQHALYTFRRKRRNLLGIIIWTVFTLLFLAMLIFMLVR